MNKYSVKISYFEYLAEFKVRIVPHHERNDVVN